MTLLLVHGLGVNSNIWDPLVSGLEGNVIVVDLPGHGRSQDKLFGWQQMWKKIVDGLGSKKSTNCTLVLHSFSAALMPEIIKSDLKFKKIVFIEGILHPDDLGWSKGLQGIEEKEFSQWLSRFRDVSEMALKSQLVTKHERHSLFMWSEGFRSTSGEAMREMASNLINRLHSNVIEKSLCNDVSPLLFLRGEQSRLGLTGRKFIEACHVPIIEIPNSGHFPMLDNPADLYQAMQ
jgi:pimeloyl-ACP methyl ester carboxylesterase